MSRDRGSCKPIGRLRHRRLHAAADGQGPPHTLRLADRVALGPRRAAPLLRPPPLPPPPRHRAASAENFPCGGRPREGRRRLVEGEAPRRAAPRGSPALDARPHTCRAGPSAPPHPASRPRAPAVPPASAEVRDESFLSSRPRGLGAPLRPPL